MRYYLQYALMATILVLASVCAGSCRDDLLIDDVPEGMARLSAEVHFAPLVTTDMNVATGGATRSDGLVIEDETGVKPDDCTDAPEGDRMDGISSLAILFYDAAGNLSKTVAPQNVDLSANAPHLEEHEGEEATWRVNFQMDVPYGNYKIFAVANVAGLLTDYADEIATISGLRSIRLKWDDTNVAANAQMLGVFTTDATDTRGWNFESDNLAQIRPGTSSIHSWMRRAVSKLTIDFDGSQLNDNVYIYIKDARIYDMADGCFLGKYSCAGQPSRDADPLPTGGFSLSNPSHRLVYGDGDDHRAWPVVVRNSSLDSYVKDGIEYKYHDDKAYCLPFYENMQGQGVSKYQDADEDGMTDHPDAGQYETDDEGNRVWRYEEAKDSKPNGTYVEVTGYYRSENAGYVSEGPIRYRFMLGKNITDNYDCERNHHYKLTLAFKGNGNDADWHIEYKDEVGIYLPNPLYISYLYNHQMNLPVRINTGGAKVDHLRVDIVSNNWAPDVPDYASHPFNYYREIDEKNGFGSEAPYNGFLSLLRVSQTMVNPPTDAEKFTYNKTYYEQTFVDADNFSISRGSRRYSVVPGVHEDSQFGNYTIERSHNIINAVIPLYTRAKQLVSATGYTGNNPYDNYQRRAVVKVTAVLADGTELPSARTEIYQVRRVVNPKGIFRNHDNTAPFNVKLMELHGEYSTEFDELVSHGPWRAYIIAGDPGFITLDGKESVEGTTDTEVGFTVGFNGTCASSTSRFAVIRVEYHNYSCVHLIFVRQGDAPVAMYDNSPLWHTYNMRTSNAEVDRPVDEGSLFKFGNWEQPIDACNNYYPGKEYWVHIDPWHFKEQGPFLLAGRTTSPGVAWTDISSLSSADTFCNTTVNGLECELPTVQDFINLRDNTEQGYGVLYGDGATTVQSDMNKVYGYRRDANGVADPTYGMRGCFVYIGYKQNDKVPRAEHIFFPIGASGYGRRKEIGVHQFGEAELHRGTLRYASGRTNFYRFAEGPLFYDLFKRQGAVYWARHISEDGTALALDINYFTFDFNTLPPGNLYGNKSTAAGNSDACMVRCITRQ